MDPADHVLERAAAVPEVLGPLPLPLPFSRNVVAYGEPFPIPAEMSDEAALARIGAAIDAATDEADRAAGIMAPAIA